jgi:hypothetical protein
MILVFDLFTLEGPFARQENLHAFPAPLKSCAPILKSFLNLFKNINKNDSIGKYF